MRSPRNSWTPERVVFGIKTLASEGHELNSTAITALWPQLASAARRNFGTVRAAVEAAGLEYVELPRTPRVSFKPLKWTEDAMLAELRRMAASGQPLTAGKVKQRGDGLYFAARQKWGTAQAAIEAAGLACEEKIPKPRATKPEPVQVVLLSPLQQSGGITYPAFEQAFDKRNKEQGVELNRIVSPLSMSEAQRLGR